MARDAFGFTLSYFEGDYLSISTNGNSFNNNLNNTITAGSIGANGLGNELFNGNIRSMATAIKDINETAIDYNVSVYGYDQLNRIKEVNVNLGTDFNNMQNHSEYYAKYTYDANGNLLTLKRNGSQHNDKFGSPTSKMDDFVYHYTSGTNQLDYVEELYTLSEASGSYTGPEFGDIQSGQLTNNYQYDKKGQLKKDLQEGIENIEWYQSGKVKAIKRNSEGNDVRFYYDPMGNRIAKVVKPRNGSGALLGQEEWVYTFYSRDASGNPLATYSKKYESLQGGQPNDYEMHYALEEQTLYGSSRLGIKNSGKDIVYRDIRVPHIIVVDGANTFGGEATLVNHTVTNEDLGFNTRNVGYKNYELSNHLGNVLAVVTDQKIAIDDHSYVYIGNNDEYYDFNASLGIFHQNASVTGQYKYSPSSGDGIIDYYEANVISYSDYYPFGMLQPNRHGQENGTNYRYNFQGQETDDEVKGKGNQIDFDARWYDPRLGRWFARDPHEVRYPFVSTYAYVLNDPITNIDPDGRDVIIVLMTNAPGGVQATGHSAILVGDDKNGWTLFEKSGEDNPDGNANHRINWYPSLWDFYSDNGSGKEFWFYFPTSSEQDKAMLAKGMADAKTAYLGVAEAGDRSNNCADLVNNILTAGNISYGEGNENWPYTKVIKNISTDALYEAKQIDYYVTLLYDNVDLQLTVPTQDFQQVVNWVNASSKYSNTSTLLYIAPSSSGFDFIEGNLTLNANGDVTINSAGILFYDKKGKFMFTLPDTPISNNDITAKRSQLIIYIPHNTLGGSGFF